MQLSIDISRPQGAQQQTNCTPLQLSIDGTDGRTDGRTPDRYIDASASITEIYMLHIHVFGITC